MNPAQITGKQITLHAPHVVNVGDQHSLMSFLQRHRIRFGPMVTLALPGE